MALAVRVGNRSLAGRDGKWQYREKRMTEDLDADL
jgi:hypothetical protein